MGRCDKGIKFVAKGVRKRIREVTKGLLVRVEKKRVILKERRNNC